LLDSRVSIELPASHRPSTGDDLARIDYPEAVARLLAITGAQSVQMVVHCYGATTFFMAMLAGLQGVRSAVVSQIAAHVDAAPAVALKSGLHVPDALAAIGVESLDTSSDPDLWNRLFDKAVALQRQPREERCDSSVCHRISFFYSLLYEHDQLTPLTHETLHELFGEANIAAFRHLGVMVRKGHLVDAAGRDVYMPHVGRLKLPLCFIHGAENACYLPRSTERTFDWLRAHNGSHLYERHVIANHGHIDCIFGKNAATAVYPLVLAHLEKYARSGAR
jgi:cholesterol oxidase